MDSVTLIDSPIASTMITADSLTSILTSAQRYTIAAEAADFTVYSGIDVGGTHFSAVQGMLTGATVLYSRCGSAAREGGD